MSIPRGRSTGTNTPNRFARLHVEPDDEALEDVPRQAETTVLHDTSRSALAKNTSPDIPFKYGLNPYRGCEHGCSYCYARPTHEYLDLSAGLDFETKIVVKPELPRLLSETLQKPSYVPEPIILSGVTDPYQPIERQMRLTRGCLEVLARHRHPVGIITKNALVTRDLDVLAELATRDLVAVRLSITSLRDDVIGPMEPRTSRASGRLRAIEKLAEAGVPVGVMVAPVIPGLTDDEMPAILRAAADAGAAHAAYTVVRLPGAVEPLFVEWIERAFPERAAKVLGRIRELRGGALDEKRFGKRMRGEGLWAETLSQLFRIECRRLGLNQERTFLSTAHFRRLPHGQGDLF